MSCVFICKFDKIRTNDPLDIRVFYVKVVVLSCLVFPVALFSSCGRRGNIFTPQKPRIYDFGFIRDPWIYSINSECRPVGLLGVLTGRQVYAWAVRDAGLSAKHSTLAQIYNQPAGGRWDFIYNSHIHRPTSPASMPRLRTRVTVP